MLLGSLDKESRNTGSIL